MKIAPAPAARQTLIALPLLLLGALGSPAQAQCGPASIGGSGGLSRGIDVSGDLAVATEHGRVTCFDVSDPLAPVPLGTAFVSSNFLWDVKLSGDYAVCADAFWGVRLVDVSQPRAPRYVSTVDTPYGPESVATLGDIVYAADGQSSVRVINISTPAFPVIVASLPITHSTSGWYVQEVEVSGNRLYVGSEAFHRVGVDVYDISIPAAPVHLGFWETPFGGGVGLGDLVVSGTTIFLTDTSLGLHILDATLPGAITEVGSLPSNFAGGAMELEGTTLFLGRSQPGAYALDVIDITNLASPNLLLTLPTPGLIDDMARKGPYALAALSDGGLLTLDLTVPTSPAVAATWGMPRAPIDVAVLGNMLFAADGAAGLTVMDITTPNVPRPLSKTPTVGVPASLELVGNTAYVAEGGAGVEVFDLTSPATPASLGLFSTPGTANAVATLGGLAFVADGSSGLYIADISNLTAPVPLSSTPLPTINSYANAVAISGSTVYVTDGNALHILDASNPSSPVWLSKFDTFSYADDVVLNGSIAYVIDYSKRVYAVDLSNPSTPLETWSGPINGSAKKAVLAGNSLFVSFNQGGWVESYDVSTPQTPVLTAATWAPTGGSGLAWSAGILYIASGSNGLHILRADGLPQALKPIQSGGCGGDVFLDVPASGQSVSGGQILAYQWRKDGVALSDGPTGSGSTLSGSTEARLVLSQLGSADLGQYDCQVTNSCGTTTSPGWDLISGGSCFTSYCSCDGSGATAPCANPGVAGHGCANSVSGVGARLSATGAPSISSSNLTLSTTDLPPNQPGLLFQGTNATAGGMGLIFGDGLRCASGVVVRLEVVIADGSGQAVSTTDLAVKGGASAGDILNYQHWYRDPTSSPCGSGFNLTNAIEAVWMP